METADIVLVATSGDGILNGRLSWGEISPEEDPVFVTVEFGGSRYEAVAETYFEALVSVRRDLEALGFYPKCNGALLNVYPSGMCLSMGEGRKAYRLTRGKHALMKDLVDIFGEPEGEDFELVTVNEQKRFFDEWIDSPKR